MIFAKKTGFTLIELLVVISILSLLSSIILSSLNSARNKAKTTVAITEMRQLTEAILLAQGNTGKTLREITGSGCTDCACRNISDMSIIPSTCYSNWVNAVDEILSHTDGIYTNIAESIYTDPWGNPYSLDENEGETLSNYCRRDIIIIVGPDNTRGTSDDIVLSLPYTGYGQRNCSN